MRNKHNDVHKKIQKNTSLQDNINKVLTYDEQLKFKAAWSKFHKKSDLFYFDSANGVDNETSKNIRGLYANGSITWSQADKILCKHLIKSVQTLQELYSLPSQKDIDIHEL